MCGCMGVSGGGQSAVSLAQKQVFARVRMCICFLSQSYPARSDKGIDYNGCAFIHPSLLIRIGKGWENLED